jgi:secondary thiamine-phosphate synthase enzyme
MEMETLQIRTAAHSCTVDITDHIAALVKEKSADNGVCLIYTPHTTAGLTINEGADPDVMNDVLETLDTIVPWRGAYKHTEGNSAAHIKAILVGGSVQVIVDSGKLVLGVWERIFLLEFDGPRTRKIFVQFLGSQAR